MITTRAGHITDIATRSSDYVYMFYRDERIWPTNPPGATGFEAIWIDTTTHWDLTTHTPHTLAGVKDVKYASFLGCFLADGSITVSQHDRPALTITLAGGTATIASTSVKGTHIETHGPAEGDRVIIEAYAYRDWYGYKLYLYANGAYLSVAGNGGAFTAAEYMFDSTGEATITSTGGARMAAKVYGGYSKDNPGAIVNNTTTVNYTTSGLWREELAGANLRQWLVGGGQGGQGGGSSSGSRGRRGQTIEITPPKRYGMLTAGKGGDGGAPDPSSSSGRDGDHGQPSAFAGHTAQGGQPFLSGSTPVGNLGKGGDGGSSNTIGDKGSPGGLRVTYTFTTTRSTHP